MFSSSKIKCILPRQEQTFRLKLKEENKNEGTKQHFSFLWRISDSCLRDEELAVFWGTDVTKLHFHPPTVPLILLEMPFYWSLFILLP